MAFCHFATLSSNFIFRWMYVQVPPSVVTSRLPEENQRATVTFRSAVPQSMRARVRGRSQTTCGTCRAACPKCDQGVLHTYASGKELKFFTSCCWLSLV
eukprot:6179134-Pleurochrysis_carterae.AAC.1